MLYANLSPAAVAVAELRSACSVLRWQNRSEAESEVERSRRPGQLGLRIPGAPSPRSPVALAPGTRCDATGAPATAAG